MTTRKRRGSGRTTPKGTQPDHEGPKNRGTKSGGPPAAGRTDRFGKDEQSRQTGRKPTVRPISHHRGNR